MPLLSELYLELPVEVGALVRLPPARCCPEARAAGIFLGCPLGARVRVTDEGLWPGVMWKPVGRPMSSSAASGVPLLGGCELEDPQLPPNVGMECLTPVPLLGAGGVRLWSRRGGRKAGDDAATAAARLVEPVGAAAPNEGLRNEPAGLSRPSAPAPAFPRLPSRSLAPRLAAPICFVTEEMFVGLVPERRGFMGDVRRSTSGMSLMCTRSDPALLPRDDGSWVRAAAAACRWRKSSPSLNMRACISCR
mmetsp:Transcript_22648/g.54208  ORF Transcript_22648/g.54208 Transcript_22648/m.54208 type:complete len:249 (+) Transcript_22648:429-1175(+)